MPGLRSVLVPSVLLGSHRRWGPRLGVVSVLRFMSFRLGTGEHCRRPRPTGGETVCPGVVCLLRLRSGGRDVGVDALTAELVIDRRLVHG